MPKLPRGFHFPPFVPVPEDLDELALRLAGRLAAGRAHEWVPMATGFPGLDALTGGGLHGGDLAVVGGVPNIGKTALVLQWARHLAADGVLAVVVCYEHAPQVLWERLLCQSAWQQGGGLTRDALREACLAVVNEAAAAADPLDAVLGRVPHGVAAWAHLSACAANLWLASGDGRHTDLEALSRTVDLAVEHGWTRMVLFVDYLQRVPVLATRSLAAGERIERVLAGLKGLAMRTTARETVLAVVAVGAADAAGLRRGRVHLENLWGPTLMQYEPDLAWIGNRDGMDGTGCPRVRWAVEKNRRGPSQVEFRHRYHGAAFWFDPEGARVDTGADWQSERDRARREGHND